MVGYSRGAKDGFKSCKAMGVDLLVHYKNTYEAARAIKGMSLRVAKQFLEVVCEKKLCVPSASTRVASAAPSAGEGCSPGGRGRGCSARLPGHTGTFGHCRRQKWPLGPLPWLAGCWR